ncbi:disulfide bond formation protein B [Roseitranquillus sediminis]|uniref:disulfide bond formation protein B n=1 Tax=Roseitranquillus sediminis TaxID=2809051 RepID=UPI001D0C0C4D|nr:disulfide bond formation protein B [Roseitranquillus sediminis]MBM9595117.1 disulfide bond formation protein B [Roseitranquillus sediminis]
MTRTADAPLLTSWLIALGSTMAVLFIGEVLGQAPCILCWYQRAFMFPLVLVLGVGFWRGDSAVWRYGLPLALAGGLIAAYHTALFAGLVPQPITPCSAAGPSCTDAGMMILAMPIPFLSLMAFGTIGALLLQLRRLETV